MYAVARKNGQPVEEKFKLAAAVVLTRHFTITYDATDTATA